MRKLTALIFLMVFVFLIPTLHPQPNLVFLGEVGLYGVEYDSTKRYDPPSYPDAGDKIYCPYKVINIGNEISAEWDVGYETWVNGEFLGKGIYTNQWPLSPVPSDTFDGISGFSSKETGQLLYDPTVEYKIRLTIDPRGKIVESDKSDNVLETVFPPLETNKINDNIKKVEKFQLIQNYPNPFNPTTTINYSLAKSGHIQLIVYNITGQQIKTLINENQAPGNYSIQFNASELPSGVYFYKLKAGNFTQTKKMILAK